MQLIKICIYIHVHKYTCDKINLLEHFLSSSTPFINQFFSKFITFKFNFHSYW